MFKFLRKHRTVVFVTLALILIGLPFFGIGGSALLSPRDTIIKVNGVKISQRQFDILNQQLLRQRENPSAEERAQIDKETLQELIRREVLFQEAKKYGVHVSEQEVQLNILSFPAFQTDGQFDPQKYVQTLAQVFRMTPKEFEEIRMKDMAATKLNNIIANSIHITEEEFQNQLKKRLEIETDAELKKELKGNPENFRNELRNREINLVFNDWLSQINSTLKINIVSKSFQDRLSGQPQ